MLNARNRCSPFTARQWQELEHQALIFKYMTYGMPVPPDLLYPIRRGWDSIPISPTLPRLFPQHPTGWGCLQMGFGRKAADPEPGRCRRTDGKKWRCSKEAYPDSKYCERHMHRGRNRSRKPVELTSTPTPSTSSPTPPSLSSSLTSSSSLSSSSSHIPTQTPHPFLYPHSSSSRTPAISLPNQNSTTHFNLDSSSYSSADKDYRYLHGLKEDIDEHAFFSEASGSLRSIPNSNLDSSWRSIQRNSSVLPSSYYSQQQQQQHCFVLGSDFESGSRAVKVERDEEPQQPLRLFFDEWPPPPPKNRDSWLDLQEDQSDRATSSTTQLSMSIPVASSLFPTGNSRSRNDD